MSRYIQRALFVCGYLFLVTVLLGFRWERLFDWKEILLVLAGCVLLTLPYRREGKTRRELLEIAGNNAMISSYLVTFILILGEGLFQDILLRLRPILYGFVMMVLLKCPEEKIGTDAGRERASLEVKKQSVEVFCREKGLTAREIEIAQLVLLGLSNREIGEQLYIEESTVKKHLSNIFGKLQIENREQLKQCLKKEKEEGL